MLTIKNQLKDNTGTLKSKCNKAGSHVWCKRKQCSHVWRKRKQCSHVRRKKNEICKHISVTQDGSNLVPIVPVTLEQQSGNEDSRNKVKDGGGGRHLGLHVNCRSMDMHFLSCISICLCIALVHTWKMQAQGNKKISISYVGTCFCIVVVHVFAWVCTCICINFRCLCEPALTLYNYNTKLETFLQQSLQRWLPKHQSYNC